MGYKKGQKYRKEPIQTELFDTELTEEEKKNAVIIYEPDAEHLKRVTNDLIYSYTKDEIYKQAQVFHPMLKGKNMLIQKADGRQVPANDILPLFSMSCNKESMTRALAYILSDPRNLKPYVDSLSEEMRELWRYLLIHIWCSEETAKNILNTTDELFNKPRYSYYSSDVRWNKRRFDFFNVSRSLSAKKERWSYRSDQFFIRINSYVQGLFFPIFYPETGGDPCIEELPDDVCTSFNFEQECFEK